MSIHSSCSYGSQVSGSSIPQVRGTCEKNVRGVSLYIYIYQLQMITDDGRRRQRTSNPTIASNEHVKVDL